MKLLAVKKPIAIEAVQWTGDNYKEIQEFCGRENCNAYPLEKLLIKTSEGDSIATNGDYVLKGIHGEFYPCKKRIFEESYTIVD